MCMHVQFHSVQTERACKKESIEPRYKSIIVACIAWNHGYQVPIPIYSAFKAFKAFEIALHCARLTGGLLINFRIYYLWKVYPTILQAKALHSIQ